MAAQPVENSTEDMTDTVWRDDEWLQFWGPLTRATALDYFALSTFNDPSSLNDRARQQGLHPSQIPCVQSPKYILYTLHGPITLETMRSDPKPYPQLARCIHLPECSTEMRCMQRGVVCDLCTSPGHRRPTFLPKKCLEQARSSYKRGFEGGGLKLRDGPSCAEAMVEG